jgi:acetoin utilization deacetylase AcuC-like enzyme
MSNLVFVYDEQFQHHLTPESHPESPNRLAAIEHALNRSELIKQVDRVAPRAASNEELASVHKPSYIEELAAKSEKAIKSGKSIALDLNETFMSPESFETAKLAAGAGLAALDAIVKGNQKASFTAVRPPGHHALAATPMGFCLFNNIAIAARYAQKELGLKRVLIIDWDVHHGNGTQDLFYDDPSVCFMSFHQYPFWPPDSGWYTEDGTGDGKGYNINIPLPAGTGDEGYLAAWDAVVKPIAMEYKPDLIMLSAGYDAHQYDPLGGQQITTPGYFLLANRLVELAEANQAKLSGLLEGGYNTQSLAEAVVTTMKVLNAADKSERQSMKPFAKEHGGDIRPVSRDRNPQLTSQRIEDLRRHLGKYWQALRQPV